MRWCLAVLSALLICTSPLFCQQPKVLAPHRQVPPKVPHPFKWHDPAVPRSMVGGFWMIDANFKSTIYLKNVVETDPITVTPILYLSNGQRYTLRAVKLEPAGVATVNINQGLADQGIASWAALTGYVEIDYTWPWNPLCVSVENVDVAHSLIFSSGFRAAMAGAPVVRVDSAATQEQVFEGMWWKQESNVVAFVALSNTSSQAIHARVQVSANLTTPVVEHGVTVSPHGTKVVSLRELQAMTAAAGGIRIAYDGSEDALIVNGELEDQGAGYSAGIPFIRQKSLSEKPVTSTYAELGLMIGAADPMISFPGGTTFTPYSVLRNVSSTTIAVTPTLWWMEGAVPQSKQLPQFQLQPGRTESLDVPSLVSLAGLKNYNGSVNITFDVQATLGGLLLAGGSVDQKNTYVFEVGPTLIQESQARSLSYWDTASGDDTMVTVWNPADEQQDFVFKLSFTGGHYKFPLHLDPRASQTFNISEIINNQIPDAEGNIIPRSIQAGSADLEGTQGENQDILVVMEAGTYNAVKATCVMRCRTCHGATSFWVQTVPFAVAVSAQTQVNAMLQYDNGSQSDLTTSSSWSSDTASVATVSSGLVSGLSPGSVNVIATSPTQTQAGTDCQPYTPPPCPRTPMQSSGPGSVVPTISISGSTYVPMLNSGTQGTDSTTLTATGNPSGGTYSWSAVSGQGNINLVNATSQSAIIQSVAVGTYTLQVTYTVNNKVGTATTVGRVQQPGSLAVISNRTPTFNCANTGLPAYNTADRLIQYETLDTSGNPIPAAGMNASETTLTVLSNTCNVNGPSPTIDAQTLSNGYFPAPDTLQLCSAQCLPAGNNGVPLGSCTMQVAQTWSVNGYQVKNDTLTYTCAGPPTGAP